MQLDYSLKTPAERIEKVRAVIAETPEEQLSNQYLSKMSDYILFITDKNQTKKEKNSESPIITRNREATVSKRQVSYEELVSNLEKGEDGLYALILNDKNQLLDQKDKITDTDIEEIPGLKEQLEIISTLKKQFDNATPANKFALKKQIIETWQQIYILKASYKNAPSRTKSGNQLKIIAHLNLPEDITINPRTQLPESNSKITLLNPAHISFLLCYYSQLKQECEDDLQCDMHFLLLDLENLITKTFLPSNPKLYDLIVWKIDGLSNIEIQEKMEEKYHENHSEQYYSTLWRKRIPKMIAEQMQKEWLIWYYTNIEYGSWKKCSKCGDYKLAHPLFFARNPGSSSGYYSICKDCKNKKE